MNITKPQHSAYKPLIRIIIGYHETLNKYYFSIYDTMADMGNGRAMDVDVDKDCDLVGCKVGDTVGYDRLSQKVRREVRLFAAELQGQRCAYCGADLERQPSKQVMKDPYMGEDFPDGFLKYPVHLHHDHQTGRIIGAVHARCNAHSWSYFGE